ncbi:Alginate biosynthesis sensor protein KinB [Ensifer sp. M14]|jgi:two-component system sensor histidine kinase TctE|uniref:sensor histidine kinase n=1 Tax=Ensifer sp. M14 TaxID=2203782 RepID=UPI000E1DE08A|nr:HAMP domain-containing sensor histidine kinase [Ensifer sp. M14]RDL48683.1 Alginate biosynthesis sensor protein KinB [Ensifer sp. M14]
MKKSRPRSLQWVLVRRLILLQAATFVALIVLLVAILTIAQPRLIIDNEAAIKHLSEALARDETGGLLVRDTEELRAFREDFPNLWFVIRDTGGHVVQEGSIPAAYEAAGGELLKNIGRATLRFDEGDRRPEAALANVDTDIGRVQILASSISSRDENHGLEVEISVDANMAKDADGDPDWLRVLPVLALLVLFLLLPIILVMGVATLVTTPAVVRRSLAGLVATADQAGRIDIDNRAVQLETAQVPTEIAPMVHAFNNALSRLDEGYDQRNRFLTDAAHELRTPIAILRTRAELLQEDPQSARLRKDIERLSHLAQQLLERQVLEHSTGSREVVDLVALAKTLAADFAPLAFEAGYELAFEAEATKPVPTSIHVQQIEQAVANLLRNAVEHGGNRGTITVLVDARGGIEVHDDGPGIPHDERERVFEPFYRLRPRSSGAGLGLNLAREIARLHGGRIDILYGSWSGARIRLQLPVLDVNHPAILSTASA